VGAGRVVLRDRRGRPSATVDWRADGSMHAASVRIPDGSWITIEPRAGVEPPWGPIDRLWREDTPLTILTAVDWAHVATIPTVAEPARIPAGGGTALLNLLALLARDQGVRRLTYEGPFPSEALFLALLECFRPETDEEPLARFTGGDLGWRPAPFTPCFDEPLYVQARERVEKVVWRGRAYYRETWNGVRRRTALRVDDTPDGVRCALWALGAPLEEHLHLTSDGTLRAIVAPPAADTPPRPVRPRIVDGVVAIVVARSAAPLAAAIREVAASLRFTCGPVDGELARVGDAEARVSATLAAAIARRLATPAAPEARAHLALAALAEIALAAGDALRARAQAVLARAAPDVQAGALAREHAEPGAAGTVTAAVADLLGSGRVDDQPGVEGEEGADGED